MGKQTKVNWYDSKFSLTLKSLEYADFKSKGSPLSVSEFEGNFAFLGDQVGGVISTIGNNNMNKYVDGLWNQFSKDIQISSDMMTKLMNSVKEVEGYLNQGYTVLNDNNTVYPVDVTFTNIDGSNWVSTFNSFDDLNNELNNYSQKLNNIKIDFEYWSNIGGETNLINFEGWLELRTRRDQNNLADELFYTVKETQTELSKNINNVNDKLEKEIEDVQDDVSLIKEDSSVMKRNLAVTTQMVSSIAQSFGGSINQKSGVIGRLQANLNSNESQQISLISPLSLLDMTHEVPSTLDSTEAQIKKLDQTVAVGTENVVTQVVGDRTSLNDLVESKNKYYYLITDILITNASTAIDTANGGVFRDGDGNIVAMTNDRSGKGFAETTKDTSTAYTSAAAAAAKQVGGFGLNSLVSSANFINVMIGGGNSLDGQASDNTAVAVREVALGTSTGGVSISGNLLINELYFTLDGDTQGSEATCDIYVFGYPVAINSDVVPTTTTTTTKGKDETTTTTTTEKKENGLFSSVSIGELRSENIRDMYLLTYRDFKFKLNNEKLPTGDFESIELVTSTPIETGSYFINGVGDQFDTFDADGVTWYSFGKELNHLLNNEDSFPMNLSSTLNLDGDASFVVGIEINGVLDKGGNPMDYFNSFDDKLELRLAYITKDGSKVISTQGFNWGDIKSVGNTTTTTTEAPYNQYDLTDSAFGTQFAEIISKAGITNWAKTSKLVIKGKIDNGSSVYYENDKGELSQLITKGGQLYLDKNNYINLKNGVIDGVVSDGSEKSILYLFDKKLYSGLWKYVKPGYRLTFINQDDTGLLGGRMVKLYGIGKPQEGKVSDAAAATQEVAVSKDQKERFDLTLIDTLITDANGQVVFTGLDAAGWEPSLKYFIYALEAYDDDLGTNVEWRYVVDRFNGNTEVDRPLPYDAPINMTLRGLDNITLSGVSIYYTEVNQEIDLLFGIDSASEPKLLGVTDENGNLTTTKVVRDWINIEIMDVTDVNGVVYWNWDSVYSVSYLRDNNGINNNINIGAHYPELTLGLYYGTRFEVYKVTGEVESLVNQATYSNDYGNWGMGLDNGTYHLVIFKTNDNPEMSDEVLFDETHTFVWGEWREISLTEVLDGVQSVDFKGTTATDGVYTNVSGLIYSNDSQSMINSDGATFDITVENGSVTNVSLNNGGNGNLHNGQEVLILGNQIGGVDVDDNGKIYVSAPTYSGKYRQPSKSK